MTTPLRSRRALLTMLPLSITTGLLAEDRRPQPDASSFMPAHGWTTTRRLLTPHATQAAAADTHHLYAISSTTVALFDRRTGCLLSTATSPTTKHLNSGFLHDGRLYCAHSNYPNTPHESDIRVYTPGSDTLEVYHTFHKPPGSLVWCIRRDGTWWCCFAHYGANNHLTCLVEYAAGGLEQERRRFLFPTDVIADFDGMSASGGIWDGDTLLASHHHFPVLYRLALPATDEQPDQLRLVETLHCPFPGQGFAIDLGHRAMPGQRPWLIGIDRPGRAVVVARPDSSHSPSARSD